MSDYVKPSDTLDENEKTGMQAFLAYNYGQYRFLQERWGADVLPFDAWIVQLGFQKLWAIHARDQTDNARAIELARAVKNALAIFDDPNRANYGDAVRILRAALQTATKARDHE